MDNQNSKQQNLKEKRGVTVFKNVILREGKTVSYIQKINKYLPIYCQIKQWTFQDSTYEQLNINQLLQNCQQIKIVRFQVHYSRDKSSMSRMIKQMGKCSFPELVSLNLMMNNLVSVQLLQTARFQNLRQLSLTLNYITHVKSLRKLYIPNVTSIQLFSNQINQLSSLIQLQNSKLSQLLLEDVGFRGQQQDQSWLLKLKSKKIRRLYLNSLTRVPTKSKFMAYMMKKFVHLIEYY